MDKTKIDLNAPAFGPDSQKLSDLSDDKPEVEAPEVEEVKKEEVTAEPSAEGSEEEPKRVTYSRFKNVWSRAEQAEKDAEEAHREAEEWKRRAEQHQEPVKQESQNINAPNWWVKLFGNDDAAMEGWKTYDSGTSEIQERMVKEAQEKALEAIKNERNQEETRVKENMNKIDSELEQLEAFVGRGLTEKEQSSVLDIVDDYSPKDDQGNYLGATIPFEKAWEIYELKNQAAKAPKTKARDNVAAINASQSQGEPSVTTEKDKNWNPLNWDDYKKRL